MVGQSTSYANKIGSSCSNETAGDGEYHSLVAGLLVTPNDCLYLDFHV